MAMRIAERRHLPVQYLATRGKSPQPSGPRADSISRPVERSAAHFGLQSPGLGEVTFNKHAPLYLDREPPWDRHRTSIYTLSC